MTHTHHLSQASKEIKLTPNELIITKTDISGHITYANRAFIRIAGYQEHELLKQPHKLIRHPDMPRGVYRLMWKTLQQEQEFFGIVKNFCKNGHFYWVLANVTPDYSNQGKLQGYYSVRRLVSPQAINTVAPLYAEMCKMEALLGKAEAPDVSMQWLLAKIKEKDMNYQDFILSINNNALMHQGVAA